MKKSEKNAGQQTFCCLQEGFQSPTHVAVSYQRTQLNNKSLQPINFTESLKERTAIVREDSTPFGLILEMC